MFQFRNVSASPSVRHSLMHLFTPAFKFLGEVFAEMLKFIGTLDGVIGRVPVPGSGRSCKDVTCGEHASCSRTTMGAESARSHGQGQCSCEGANSPGLSSTAQDAADFRSEHREIISDARLPR